MNYSEYGTQVNNVLYSCDFSEKPSRGAQFPEKPPSAIANVREIIDRKRKAQRPAKPPEGRMAAGEDGAECQCGAAPHVGELGEGWEGTAVLNHGSLVRFGCATFVFSIVECASI